MAPLLMGAVVCLALAVYALATQHVALAAVAVLVLALLVALAARQRTAPAKPAGPRNPAPEKPNGASVASVADTLFAAEQVPGPRGDLGQILFRSNGAVVVLDTQEERGTVTEAQGSLRLNGRPLEFDVVDRTRRNALWVRDQLRTRYGIDVFVTAVVVFPNGQVAVRRPIRGVEIAGERFVQTLLGRLAPDSRAAATARAKLDAIKAEIGTWHRDRRPARSASHDDAPVS